MRLMGMESKMLVRREKASGQMDKKKGRLDVCEDEGAFWREM
jgi:hypothetical protein